MRQTTPYARRTYVNSTFHGNGEGYRDDDGTRKFP